MEGKFFAHCICTRCGRSIITEVAQEEILEKVSWMHCVQSKNNNQEEILSNTLLREQLISPCVGYLWKLLTVCYTLSVATLSCQKDYSRHPDKIDHGGLLGLCRKYGLECTVHWYDHFPPWLVANKETKIMWDRIIFICLQSNCPDIKIMHRSIHE